MKPGTLVELPDGSFGYFQSKDPSGAVYVMQYVLVAAADAKKMKEVKTK
jgi:hypothetical protein